MFERLAKNKNDYLKEIKEEKIAFETPNHQMSIIEKEIEEAHTLFSNW